MITKKEFKLRHKKEIEDIFKQCGWSNSTNMYVEDCLEAAYWYKDPIRYKTSLNNLNPMDFNDGFIELFGEDILKNKRFLKKIKAINNSWVNSCLKASSVTN